MLRFYTPLRLITFRLAWTSPLRLSYTPLRLDISATLELHSATLGYIRYALYSASLGHEKEIA